MSHTNIEIKPCPFCGSHDIHFYDQDNDSFIKTIVAQCNECLMEISVNFDKREYVGWSYEYINAWNTKIKNHWNTRIGEVDVK